MNKPPAVVELPFAPVMQEMARGQAFIIDTFGAEPQTGHPLVVNDQNGFWEHQNTLPSVRVIIGTDQGGQKADYLEVTDISASPWFDTAKQAIGNFALVHWTEQRGNFVVANFDYMGPNQLFAVGQATDYDKRGKGKLPPTVNDQHVTIGLRRKKNESDQEKPPKDELFIRNHAHDGRTLIWNLRYGENRDVPITIPEEQLTDMQALNARRIGKTITRGNIKRIQE